MSDNTDEPAITRRSSHVEPLEGEAVPPAVPPRPPVPGPPDAESAPPPRTSPRVRPRWVLPVVTGVLGLVLGALLSAVVTASAIAVRQQAETEAAAVAAEEAKSEFFEDAARRCGLTGVVEIADEGKTMIVDGAGEEVGSGDVDFTDLDCIIEAVDAPASVVELMYQTRSLDGRQSADWDDVTASWSYHPDDGLDIIFELDD